MKRAKSGEPPPPGQQPRRRLHAEDIGDVTVVTFLERKILDEQNIQFIGQQLFDLVDKAGKRSILLNFKNVEYLSSAANGKLITLNKKLMTHKGRLALCAIVPEIREVFDITGLARIYLFFDDEAQALRNLARTMDMTCPVDRCVFVTAYAGSIMFDTPQWHQCPACASVFRVNVPVDTKSHSMSVPVLNLRLPTYEREYIHVDSRAPYKLSAHGRLDLFASEQLHKAAYAIPERSRMIIDLRYCTQLSSQGAAALQRLCDALAAVGAVALILNESQHASARALGVTSPIYVHEHEAVASLGPSSSEGAPSQLEVAVVFHEEPS